MEPLLPEYKEQIKHILYKHNISPDTYKLSYSERHAREELHQCFTIKIDAMSFNIFIPFTSFEEFKFSFTHFDPKFSESIILPRNPTPFIGFKELLAHFEDWIKVELNKYLRNTGYDFKAKRNNTTIFPVLHKTKLFKIIENENLNPSDFKIIPAEDLTLINDTLYGLHKLNYKDSPMSFNIYVNEHDFQKLRISYTAFNSRFSEIDPYTNNYLEFDQIESDVIRWVNNHLTFYIAEETLKDPFAPVDFNNINSDLFPNDDRKNNKLSESEIIILNKRLDELKEFIEQSTTVSSSEIMLRNDVALSLIAEDIEELKGIVEKNSLSKKSLGKLISKYIVDWGVEKLLDNIFTKKVFKHFMSLISIE